MNTMIKNLNNDPKISGQCRHYSFLDQCLMVAQNALTTVFGNPPSTRPMPKASLKETLEMDAQHQNQNSASFPLTLKEKRHSAGLMRINHAGEVSAQALYQAQSLTARSEAVRHSMQLSAQEENDHLIWCKQRLTELESRPSYLNSFWYAGSFIVGLMAGRAGDAISLGFVAETERQVVQHLQSHLTQLPQHDEDSRAILIQMREDEAHHGTVAIKAGAVELPFLIKKIMRILSKVMTVTAYRV